MLSLLNFLSEVKSSRRKQGQQYDTGSVLMLSILAMSSGAVSYRKIHEYMTIMFPALRQLLNLNWKKPPVYNSLRYILISVNTSSLEKCFRKYSKYLQKMMRVSESNSNPDYLKKYDILSVDGKCLKNSFDNMKEQKMKQILSVFDADKKLILAHKEISDKTNEIPEFQSLIKELNLEHSIFTADAIHNFRIMH